MSSVKGDNKGDLTATTMDYPKKFNEDWIILFDNKTKKEYYANMKLNITQWVPPVEVSNQSQEGVNGKNKKDAQSGPLPSSSSASSSQQLNDDQNNIQISPRTAAGQTAVGNTEGSSPQKEKRDSAEVATPQRKPVTYLHMNDPFSLKLLIWLKETNYLDYVELRTVNESTQFSVVNTEFQQLQIEIYKSLNQKNYALQEVSYPMTMYPSGEIITGADHNIHTFLSHYSNSSTNEINWNSLTVFNFYSCGLLLEHSNHLHDADLTTKSNSSTSTLGSGSSSSSSSSVGAIYSQEYLSLHEENIRLQLYLSGNQIQQFRSEQSYRIENQRLRDEIEKLSSRLVELTHKLSIERTAIYNKMNENKNLHEALHKLEEEKRGLVSIMTTQSKVHSEQLTHEVNQNIQQQEYLKEIHVHVLGEVCENYENKERSLMKFKTKIEEYQQIIQIKDQELCSLRENMSKLQSHLGKAQTDLQLFQQIIRE